MGTGSAEVRASEGVVRATISVALPLAGVAAGITMLFLGMRAVMDIGGVCAGGQQPFPISRPCPKGVGLVMFAGIWGGLIFAGIYVWQTIKHQVPSFVWLFWPALFLSLGWNFLEYGIRPPGGSGLVWGWLICGIVFVLMGGIPLIAVGPTVLRAFRTGPPEQPDNPSKLGMMRDAMSMMPAVRQALKSWRTSGNVEDMLRRISEASGAGGTSPTIDLTGGGGATAAADPSAPGGDELVSALERLEALHRTGALSDQEYAEAKARVLRGMK